MLRKGTWKGREGRSLGAQHLGGERDEPLIDLEHKCTQATPTCAANDNSAKEGDPSRLAVA